MRAALVDPPWSFGGSVYFGCREPHLPLELGYAARAIAEAGHEAEVFPAQLMGWDTAGLRDRVAAYRPDLLVVATAPSYLFWRCAQPELRVPRETLDALRDLAPRTVAVGPHGSTAPAAALRKLDVDAVVMGECEEVLADLCARDWEDVPSIARRDGGGTRVQGGLAAASFVEAPPLEWPAAMLARHRHHHHRFDREPDGPGAEAEASRGCPYSCTFCAKEAFRDRYRRRRADLVLAEIDGLKAAGAAYVYFVDEIFLPDRRLLQGLVGRGIAFGVQTRIDLWKPEMLELLGEAGCVSIEAGVESLTPEGRERLRKDCRVSTEDLTERLVRARRHVPFVQANLIDAGGDDPEAVAAWRDRLRGEGVWANDPVPLFPYPGSPDYRRLWGLPDDRAWERAHAHYLDEVRRWSDIQDQAPRPLAELEACCG
jgi:anaerobic magnesium-protoporphyrin IX monomethyl ester cyclase